MNVINPDKPDFEYLDFLKGAAILSLVLLHVFPPRVLIWLLAPLHIWQAVPALLFAAGLTATFTFSRYAGDLKAYYCHLPARIFYLYLAYLAVVLLCMGYESETMSLSALLSHLILGSKGPGGYFVSLFCQHLAIFPLLLLLRQKLGNDRIFLAICFAVSAILEFLCRYPGIGADVYRILYVRYLAVAALGAVCARGEPWPRVVTLVLAVLSFAYIALVCYFGLDFGFIPADWGFQHYPAWFYTLALVLLLKEHYRKIPFQWVVAGLGRAWTAIFLVQMWFFATVWVGLADHWILRALLAPPLCLILGWLLQRGLRFLAALRNVPITPKTAD